MAKKTNKKMFAESSDDESSVNLGANDDPMEDIDMEELSKTAMSGARFSILHSFCWWRVVLDEAHYIKSRSSQTAAAAFSLTSVHRWCLSGTPLQNRVGERKCCIERNFKTRVHRSTALTIDFSRSLQSYSIPSNWSYGLLLLSSKGMWLQEHSLPFQRWKMQRLRSSSIYAFCALQSCKCSKAWPPSLSPVNFSHICHLFFFPARLECNPEGWLHGWWTPGNVQIEKWSTRQMPSPTHEGDTCRGHESTSAHCQHPDYPFTPKRGRFLRGSVQAE